MKFVDMNTMRGIPQDSQIHDGDYRRGFCHGYLAAIEDLERKKTLKEMIKFFDEELMNQWRRDRLNEFISPPVLK